MAGDYRPRLGRIPIRDLAPRQPEGLWPAKAYLGEVVPFAATIFKEGHEQLGARLLLTDPAGRTTTWRMRETVRGTDRFEVLAPLDREGEWTWRVRAFADDWASWLHAAAAKIEAGVEAELMIEVGLQLLRRAGKRKIVLAAMEALQDAGRTPAEKLAVALEPELTAAIEAKPLASLTTETGVSTLRVERQRAGVGSWYEFFPRSEGAIRQPDGSWTSGTLRTAAKRLRGIADMGFDVVYLPPIHPIGRTHRKGPNNTLTAGPEDPGSPWAIGAAEGGHFDVHPDLGTLEDFDAFVAKAAKHGIEVALDLALQCSPDHPWVTEHPEWFSTRPDGSIAFAENPPKQYQDIYPLNFDNDPEGIRAEVTRLIEHWIGHGVRIFRVDNPHTKPLQFWEVLLHELRQQHPDVIFLAEAFTRPPMLHALAQAGFQQSYTYFTWRNTKPELEEFLHGLSKETAAFLRPNLFVNTPDILTEYLQFGGPAAFTIRAAIAATASPTWGVYAGFELFESVARPGAEEYLDNEKYQYRPRDFAGAQQAGRSLAPYLRQLNLIRAAHPSLRQLRNLDVHWSDDEHVLVYSRHLDGAFVPGGVADTVIVVANVDPHSVRETLVHLDVTRFGMPLDSRFEVRDLITGAEFDWGPDNFVRLGVSGEPVHILRVDHTTVR